jgi:hypothetical protein
MDEDMEAIYGLKHLPISTCLSRSFSGDRIYGEPVGGKLLPEPAKCADANDEVTERDTSTKLFSRREIFTAKFFTLKKRNHEKPSVK